MSFDCLPAPNTLNSLEVILKCESSTICSDNQSVAKSIVGQFFPSDLYSLLQKKLLLNKKRQQNNQNKLPRSTLLKIYNWISTLCWSSNIGSKCLFLCIGLFNSLIEIYTIEKCKLQGMAVTCLWISCKYMGHKKLFSSSDLSWMCKGIYSTEQIEHFQATILSLIDWDLEQPHTLNILDSYLDRNRIELTEKQYTYAVFWMQIQLLFHENPCKYSIWDIVTSVVNLVKSESGRMPSDPILCELLALARNPPFQTVIHKYQELFDVNQYLDKVGIE